MEDLYAGSFPEPERIEEYAPPLADPLPATEDEGPGYDLESADRQGAISVPELRRRIVEGALKEWEEWGQGKLKETDASKRRTLREYWLAARVPANAVESKIDERRAWSAAFISFVMDRAGAGSTFPYSASHQGYISATKRNREQRNTTSPFWSYRITEISPAPGDIICQDRPPDPNAACGGATYENISDRVFRPSHGDIVTGARGNELLVVGGNVSDSVNRKRLKIDDRGLVVPDQKTCRFFAVVRLGDHGDSVTPVPPPPVAAGGGVDLERAVRFNREYARRLGWGPHYPSIARVLGLKTAPPAERTFADAVARWQGRQGLAVDGIVGPNTWAALRRLL